MSPSSSTTATSKSPGAWSYLFCLNTMLLEAVLFVYMAVTILSRSKTDEEMDINGSLALSWLVIAFVIARGALSPSDIVKRESTLVMTIFHALNTILIIYQYFTTTNSSSSSSSGGANMNAFLVDLGVSIALFCASLYCYKVYRLTIKLSNKADKQQNEQQDNKTADKKSRNKIKITNKKENTTA